MNILEIKNLNFSYGEKQILKNIHLSLKQGSWNTIIGLSGTGKSTLLKMILGLIETDASITIDNLLLNKSNLFEIRKKIGVVFENPEFSFVTETVKDDLAFTLENMQYCSEDIKKRIKEVAECLKITKMLNKNPHSLSGGEKQMVAFACAIIHKPKLLIFDEAFSMIDSIERQNILKIVKKMQQEENITILQVTHDMEECLFSDNLYVLQDGHFILQGLKEDVFKEEAKLTKIGLELPFLVNLSKKLQYYDLIDRYYYNMEQLVDALWK